MSPHLNPSKEIARLHWRQRFTWGLMGFVLLVAVITGFTKERPEGQRCSDFRTQIAAQRAFLGGLVGLDGDGDRHACEALP